MRIGHNPHKDQPTEDSHYFHQVVVPVSIPSEADYFRDAFQIFDLCITSLLKTAHPATFITVVSNNSIDKVTQYLDQLLQTQKIHEVIYTGAIGKTNAVLKGIAGHNFPLVTITDADVLFLTNWQKAAYEVFDAFPQAGAISTTPLSRRLRYFTENIYSDLFLSKRLQFTSVKDPDAMRAFAASIGDPDFIRDVHLQKNLTITQNGIRALVGAGHFCCTYKGIIFNELPGFAKGNITFAGGNALKVTIDEQVALHGYYRLSTESNHTFHMGNVVEPWMEEKIEDLKPAGLLKMPKLQVKHLSKVAFFFQQKVIGKLIRNPLIWFRFLQLKGLNSNQARTYF
jgi:hypothetical protein